MKTAITVRLDPDLLSAVRASADRENRTLTNFIETALKEHIEGSRFASRPTRVAGGAANKG